MTFPRALAPRRLAPVLALVTSAALCALAAPAQALVTSVEVKAGESATFGVMPSNGQSVVFGNGEMWTGGPEPVVAKGYEPRSFANSEGHPVVHGSEVYAVYWDPTGGAYHGDWQEIIDTFLNHSSLESSSRNGVASIESQYTDSSNEPAKPTMAFRSAGTDTHPYPAAGCTDPKPLKKGAITCLTDAQLREQLGEYITVHSLPKGMHAIYYVLTPPGVTVCLDSTANHCSDFSGGETEESYKHSFCSYHGAINPGGLPTGDSNTVLYGAIPWIAGLAGDGAHTAEERQPTPYWCQDGGFNPASKPPLKREEKIAIQEPNQEQCPSRDGYCDAGLADLIINQISLEQQDIVTDPLLNAWSDPKGNEASDECRNYFYMGKVSGSYAEEKETEAGTLSNEEYAGKKYYLNMAFNLSALMLPYPGIPCMPGDRLEAHFNMPNPVNSGETVGFDGMESDITMNTRWYFVGGIPQHEYATFKWNFGDGSPVVEGPAPGTPPCEEPWPSRCAASVFHSYKYGGSYNVSLNVRDVGGYETTYTNAIHVNGPLPPNESNGSGSGSGSSSGASSGTSSTAGTASSSGTAAGSGAGAHPSAASHPALAAPVAAAAISTHSLKRVLRNGLSVRYSVDQQVAGRVEVLMGSALARRLHISGTPALGLPAGTPPQLVIAKAVLITTTPGRNTITIQLPKRVSSRLAHLRSVSLMLRMIVRNAASLSPATTTVLTSYTLSK